MKIAIFGDTHLGYPRFEEDSYRQAEKTIIEASKKADVILCAGDIFDAKVPKLETLKKAVEIFKKSSKPIFAIFGNHERRAKEFVNPVQLLAAGTDIRLLHAETGIFKGETEKLQIFGIGAVPEEYAVETIKRALAERFNRDENAFAILMIHQTIKDLVPASNEELSLDFLESLPFDLIINGHIHERTERLGGRFLIPGSTTITQLRKSETGSKGYYLYDTKTNEAEFIEIDSRKFFYEEIKIEDAGETMVNECIRKKIELIREKHPESIIAIKIRGSLKEGLSNADIKIEKHENVFIENKLNADQLGAKLEMIRNIRNQNLSIREIAIRELKSKTKNSINLFDSAEIFEKLLVGVDETVEYIEDNSKKQKKSV